jgi:hypothetical protein
MGSAVTQRHGRTLLLGVERLNNQATVKTGEPDVAAAARLITAALQDPERRVEVTAYLAAFLTRCLAGSVPDIRRWDP